MIEPTDVSRRRLLQITGGLGVVALAGCTGSSNDAGGSARPIVVQFAVPESKMKILETTISKVTG